MNNYMAAYELVFFKPNIMLIKDLKEQGRPTLIESLGPILLEIASRTNFLNYKLMIKDHKNIYYMAVIRDNQSLSYKPISKKNLQLALEAMTVEQF
jgi:hypothetical protein